MIFSKITCFSPVVEGCCLFPIWDYCYLVCYPINLIYLVEPAPCVEEPVGYRGGDNETERDEAEEDEMKGDVIASRYKDHLCNGVLSYIYHSFCHSFISTNGGGHIWFHFFIQLLWKVHN